MTPVRVGILTVSDRSFQGLREDAGGPALASAVENEGWVVAARSIVPDGKKEISSTLCRWADEEGWDVLLTTGGTGLSPRDVTPEATAEILEKQIPGLGEIMRREGLSQTPLAALSRALCGSRGRALIINLPGNPSGALRSFQSIKHLIPHALKILRGGDHENLHAHVESRRSP